MLTMVPTRSAPTLETTLRGQPSTPRQLGIYNPTNPTFSDMLRKGEMRPPAPGCPLPPHMPNIPGNGPPDPPSPSSQWECSPQSPRGPQDAPGPGGPPGPPGPPIPPDGPPPPGPPVPLNPPMHPLGPPVLTFDHKLRGSDIPKWDGAPDGYKLIQWMSECRAWEALVGGIPEQLGLRLAMNFEGMLRNRWLMLSCH